jgi:phenylacetate-CoA ligase
MERIPITPKKDLIDAFPKLTLSSFERSRNWALTRTSGSTGQPLKLYIDLKAYNRKYSLLLRGYHLSGWDFGDKILSIWHRGYGGYFGKYTQNNDEYEPHHLIRNIVYKTIHRKKILKPALEQDSNFDQNTLLYYIQTINSMKPDLLEANEFYLKFLADFLRENPRISCSIRSLNSIGLLSDKARAEVEEAFSGTLYNRYGPHEMEGIAHHCEKREGMHISKDSYFVEFLKPDNSACEPNECGRLVITDLDNRAMPLIRYDIGDIGKRLPGLCSCGRGLPLMGNIEGRVQDSFVQGNTYITEKVFLDFFDNIEWIRNFQIIENEDSSLQLKLVPIDSQEKKIALQDDQKRIKKVIGGLAGLFQKERKIIPEFVQGIPAEKSGKFRYVKRFEGM